ncbi:MAG: hypothetical protein EA381_11970 [Planctomycetaceae bacterium]|nr:MAG: hypothetical protein EA381_11970 [Planctomycetaceae bacterium]
MVQAVRLNPCILLLAASGHRNCPLVAATASPQTSIHCAAVKYGSDQHEANGGLEPGGHRNSRRESEPIRNYRHHLRMRSNETSDNFRVFVMASSREPVERDVSPFG